MSDEVIAFAHCENPIVARSDSRIWRGRPGMSDPVPTVGAVDDCTLLPDLPRLLHRYQVTVTLPRAAGNGALLPPGAQAVVELAAAAVAAEGLLTAWTSSKTVLSMVVELPCAADALAAGAAAARALGGGQGTASVAAELAA